MDKYDTLRSSSGFSWKVLGNVYTLMEYENISLYEYYTSVEANIHLYRIGRPKLREVFGEDIEMPAVSTPHLSYGHISALGAEPRFPKDGEVAAVRRFGSLTEAVGYLQMHPVDDYASAGIAPMYLGMRERLVDAFPGEPIGYGASGQGPVTSAFLLNGEGVYLDVYDDPELLKTYLGMLARSENEYLRFVCNVLGRDPMRYCYMADDSASFLPSDLFPSLVLPFWEEQFRARSNGPRYIHCEGLRKSQLRHLETIGIDSYDPSISPMLTPRIVTDNCRVPFDWRLASFHLWGMTVQQVRDFVYHLAADGASGTFLVLTENMSEGENLKKVMAYISACKETAAALAKGTPREELRSMAEVKDGNRYWKTWIGYKGGEGSR